MGFRQANPGGDRLDDGAEPLLARAQFVLGADARADVADARLDRLSAIARTAGCWFTSSISAHVPSYEIPSEPTDPFDHGWRTIQSTTSRPSFTSSSAHGYGQPPNDAPVPRTSTSTHA